jgi:hypothetical protein
MERAQYVCGFSSNPNREPVLQALRGLHEGCLSRRICDHRRAVRGDADRGHADRARVLCRSRARRDRRTGEPLYLYRAGAKREHDSNPVRQLSLSEKLYFIHLRQLHDQRAEL